MSYDEMVTACLAPLGVPVSKPPAGGQHETYITFNEAMGSYAAYASNAPRRMQHLIQIHAFSRLDDGTHEAIFREALTLLRAAGVRVGSYGPDTYEQDTGYHHIAATCEWNERVNEDSPAQTDEQKRPTEKIEE